MPMPMPLQFGKEGARLQAETQNCLLYNLYLSLKLKAGKRYFSQWEDIQKDSTCLPMPMPLQFAPIWDEGGCTLAHSQKQTQCKQIPKTAFFIFFRNMKLKLKAGNSYFTSNCNIFPILSGTCASTAIFLFILCPHLCFRKGDLDGQCTMGSLPAKSWTIPSDPPGFERTDIFLAIPAEMELA